MSRFRDHLRPRAALPLTALLLTLSVGSTGCGGASEVAKESAEQGRPCTAAELAPSNATYLAECEAQKNREAAAKEDHEVQEAEREAQRLGG